MDTKTDTQREDNVKTHSRKAMGSLRIVVMHMQALEHQRSSVNNQMLERGKEGFPYRFPTGFRGSMILL